MANLRIRLEADIELYLRSQSERVLGTSEPTAADVTTLTNRIIYEHKLAQSMMRQEFIPRLLGWLKGIMPGSTATALPEQKKEILQQAQALDLDFATDFAAQFDEAA